MKRKLTLLALLTAVAMVAAACPAEEEEVTTGPLGAVTIGADDPIRIASFQSISGETASLGNDQVRGVEIAIEDLGGELLGHEIQLQSEDDLCSSQGGQSGIAKILANEDTVAIIGTSCSGAGVPAAEAMSEAGLVMVSGSNTSPILTSVAGVKGSANQPGYFRTAHNDAIQGEAAATFVFKELKLTKAATIHDGDPYTEGLANAFGASFKKLGGTIVKATAVGAKDTDMRPVLTEVSAAGPELIFFPIFQPAGDFIAKQAKEIAGLKDKAILMGADGLLSDTYVTIPETKGIYFSGPATPSGKAYDDFVAAYEKKYGEKPIQAFHAHAYDALNMLAAAIEEVADQKDDGSLVIDRQKLRDALYDTTDFKGLTGSLTCDEFGDCADPKIQVFRNTAQTADITAVKKNILFTFEE